MTKTQTQTQTRRIRCIVGGSLGPWVIEQFDRDRLPWKRWFVEVANIDSREHAELLLDELEDEFGQMLDDNDRMGV